MKIRLNDLDYIRVRVIGVAQGDYYIWDGPSDPDELIILFNKDRSYCYHADGKDFISTECEDSYAYLIDYRSLRVPGFLQYVPRAHGFRYAIFPSAYYYTEYCENLYPLDTV